MSAAIEWILLVAKRGNYQTSAYSVKAIVDMVAINKKFKSLRDMLQF